MRKPPQKHVFEVAQQTTIFTVSKGLFLASPSFVSVFRARNQSIMDPKEVPRLTGLLRTFLTEQGENFDFQNEYLQRLEVIKRRQKRSTTAQPEGFSSSSQLTWSFFGSLLENYEIQEAKNIRTQYNKFLSETKKLIEDDQMSSDELHSAAYVVYQTVKDPNKSLREKEELLREYFPTVTTKQIEDLTPLVTQLSSWREQKLSSKPRSQRQESEVANGTQNVVEFGKDVVLSYDPKFFVDDINDDVLNDENIDIVENETTAQTTPNVPVSSSEKEIELLWSPSREVDANWLQEQCENYTAAILASGGTPPMTPFELARTLHQNLQSKKTDNELQEILFDLLGPNSLEFIKLLLKNRMKLVKLNWDSAQQTQRSFY